MGHREDVAIEASADVLDATNREYAINNLELNSTRLREVRWAGWLGSRSESAPLSSC
jgi:hypothetical protein